MADTADKTAVEELQSQHHGDIQKKQIQTARSLTPPAVLEDAVSVKVCLDAHVSFPTYFIYG